VILFVILYERERENLIMFENGKNKVGVSALQFGPAGSRTAKNLARLI
jgi:hypothetical protein